MLYYSYCNYLFNQSYQLTKQLWNMKRILMLLSLTLLTAATYAQGIKGKVTDEKSGSGMPGVTILIQGTNNGTVTDAEGNYNLSIGSGSYQVVVSFIGYTTQTIKVDVNGQKELNVISI